MQSVGVGKHSIILLLTSVLWAVSLDCDFHSCIFAISTSLLDETGNLGGGSMKIKTMRKGRKEKRGVQ